MNHPFAHFWAYGVIKRGWFSPYLFDTKGLMPLRIRYDSYRPRLQQGNAGLEADAGRL